MRQEALSGARRGEKEGALDAAECCRLAILPLLGGVAGEDSQSLAQNDDIGGAVAAQLRFFDLLHIFNKSPVDDRDALPPKTALSHCSIWSCPLRLDA